MCIVMLLEMESNTQVNPVVLRQKMWEQCIMLSSNLQLIFKYSKSDSYWLYYTLTSNVVTNSLLCTHGYVLSLCTGYERKHNSCSVSQLTSFRYLYWRGRGKFLQNFISSRDGAVICISVTRQGWKYVKDYPNVQ